MLDQAELKRRLAALRMLRGVSQVQLAAKLKAEGIAKYDLARAEQGRKDMSSSLRRELARILRAPESYFLEPDVDAVLFKHPEAAADRADLDDAARRFRERAQKPGDPRAPESPEDQDAEQGSTG